MRAFSSTVPGFRRLGFHCLFSWVRLGVYVSGCYVGTFAFGFRFGFSGAPWVAHGAQEEPSRPWSTGPRALESTGPRALACWGRSIWGPHRAPWGPMGAPWGPHEGPWGTHGGPWGPWGPWGPMGPYGPPLRCGDARSAIYVCFYACAALPDESARHHIFCWGHSSCRRPGPLGHGPQESGVSKWLGWRMAGFQPIWGPPWAPKAPRGQMGHYGMIWDDFYWYGVIFMSMG